MKRLSFAILLALLSVSLWGNPLERRVIYTLLPGEVLSSGEYIVNYSLSGSKFALITYDAQAGVYKFIFNGKLVETFENMEFIYNLGYIDVNKPDGYIIRTKRGDDYYVNRGGKLEGPYEYVFWGYSKEYEDQYRAGVKIYPMSTTYHYILANRVYENRDGKLRKSEGFYKLGNIYGNEDFYVAANDQLVSVPRDGWLYSNEHSYVYVTNTSDIYKSGLYFNGHSIDSADEYDLDEIRFNDRGDCAYSYRNDNAWYVAKNGTVINGPDDFPAQSLNLTSTGEVAYISNIWESLHLPGMPVNNTFEEVRDLVYLDSEHYGFSYKQNGKWFVRIKGQLDRGPYDGVEKLTLNRNGKFAYLYIDEVQRNYVRTSVGEYGPFDGLYDNIEITDNGKYSFMYVQDGQYYQFDDGKIVKHYPDLYGQERWDCIDIEENGHSFYSYYQYGYVVIDGVRVGNSAALQARYDKKRNAFVWLSLEEQELVVYEYGLD